eukprot:s1939_g3.t1
MADEDGGPPSTDEAQPEESEMPSYAPSDASPGAMPSPAAKVADLRAMMEEKELDLDKLTKIWKEAQETALPGGLAANHEVLREGHLMEASDNEGRRALDAAALSRWADMWCAKLAPFLDVSANFAELGSLATGCLRKVLQCKSASASTLRRHMCGLKVFLEFRDGEDAHNICNPGRLVLISFLSAVGEGKRSVACAVSALKFTAALMGWQEFLCDLDCQVVSAWKQPVGPARACKEAMPLPLCAIAKLERAVMASGSFVKSMDTFLIVCFLVMFWGGLAVLGPAAHRSGDYRAAGCHCERPLLEN